eukprot:5607863-Alexandrium_andersonii.AAC.1
MADCSGPLPTVVDKVVGRLVHVGCFGRPRAHALAQRFPTTPDCRGRPVVAHILVDLPADVGQVGVGPLVVRIDQTG